MLAGIDAFDKWLPTLSRADKPPVDALASIARGAMPNVAVPKGSRPRKDQQVRPADQLKAIEMLLDRGFGRFTTAIGCSPQCL